MSDTFCVLPWKLLWIHAYGGARPCSKYSGPFCGDDGRELSAQTHSLEEIWNSTTLRDLRRGMVRGETLAACELCYQEEAQLGFSQRTIMQQAWQEGWLNAEGETLEQLKADAVASDYRADLPSSLGLMVGNPCNLKCRMCDAYGSSRIERDPVQTAWRGNPADDPNYLPFSSPDHWFRRRHVIQDLLRQPERFAWISLSGGETLLIKEVGSVLQHLVEQGVAAQISVDLDTNATYIHAPWLPLLRKFKQVRVVFSIDGFGRFYEYIRYPAEWVRVAGNMAMLRQMLPNAQFDTLITVQNYNMLNLTELLRYLDEIGQDFTLNFLDGPAYLRAGIMPPNVQQVAAARLRDYASQSCRDRHREQVVGLAASLESADESVDGELLHQFMLFTNDLDVTRGQSFAETHAELLHLLTEAGMEWTAETCWAPGTPEAEASAEENGTSFLSLPLVVDA